MVINGSMLNHTLSQSINQSMIEWCICVQGLLYGQQIQHLVRTVMNLHVALQKPMTKTAVLALCKMVELLKVYMDRHWFGLMFCMLLSNEMIV